jgi:Ca-activated chloride channel family protein
MRGSDFIAPENSIGLVLFSDAVSTVLPIKELKLKHKGALHAAVLDMQAAGKTAMYDGIVAGLHMLLEEGRRRPEAKLMMFVLTDGESNAGLSYEAILPVIRALRIPIFTIGYEADLEVLKRLSSIVEAASIDAREGEVGYTIGSLFNAQM